MVMQVDVVSVDVVDETVVAIVTVVTVSEDVVEETVLVVGTVCVLVV